MPELTEKESERIQIEKNAFETFLGPVRVERAERDLFNIYYPANTNNPFTICRTIENVRGFLWGCVAGVEDPRFRELRLLEARLVASLEERC